MTVFLLQIIAMVTMVCDHLGCIFFTHSLILRCIGRFAFPIYALLVVEGYRHIKNDPARVEKHLGGYIVLALVSEFCYDFQEFSNYSITDYMTTQNCIITLLLGFLGLMAIDRWKDTNKFYMWATIGLTAMINFLVLSNYKFTGVLLMYAFYYYLNRYEDKSYLWRLSHLLIIFICYIPLYHWARYNFCGFTEYMQYLQGDNTYWYLTHGLIAALLATYTGVKGNIPSKFKVVYRNFYPGHLFILGILRHFIFKV